jgi:hypothetical protein
MREADEFIGTVRPERVEGLSFISSAAVKEGQGFDRLSPNGGV